MDLPVVSSAVVAFGVVRIGASETGKAEIKSGSM